MARGFDDASSESLSVDNPPVTAPPFTMACWFRSDDVTVDQALMQICKSSATSQYHALMIKGATGGDPVTARTRAGSTYDAVSSTGFSANTWHHACGVWSAADNRAAFIDGGSKGTETTSATPGTPINRFAVGALLDSSPSDYMSGNLAELAVWDVALTDAEVAVLAQGYCPLLVRPASLVRYVPLIRDADQDIIGGIALSVGGTPTVEVHPRIFYQARRRMGIPSAAGPTTLTPDAVAIPLVIPAPTIVLGAIAMAPDAVAMPLVVPDPVISLGELQLSPSAVAIPVAIPDPTLVFGAKDVTPSAVAIALVVPQPTITLGALTMSPDAVGMPIAIPTPAITLGALDLAPDAVSIPLVIPAPTIDTGIRDLTPDAVQILLVLPEPTLTIPEAEAAPTGGWLRKEEIEYLRQLGQPVRAAQLIIPNALAPEVADQLLARAVQAEVVPLPALLREAPGLFQVPRLLGESVDIARIIESLRLAREQQDAVQLAILLLLLDEL